MFERQVTSLLTHLLGNYVEPSCFRHDKVNVGVWSGYVVLQHLELQRKIYPDLGVAVVRGVLGQITIKIPWNRLVYDSVLVTIDDVYILLRNVNREDLVPPTAEMEQILKKKLIEELYQAKLDTDNAAVDDSFLLRLRTKIIDNLEFHIRRIHIRFQDASSGDHPYTFGLTMESLHVQSTDSNWQPSYVDASTTKEPMIYKSFELNHLSLYLNPDCALHGHEFFDGAACSLDQFTEAFSRSIPQRIDLTRLPPTPQGETKHHYILKPVNASAHLKMKRDYNDNKPAVPNMDLQVLIDEVALQLEESQYCDLLFLRSAIKTSQQAKLYEKYHRYRPIKSVFEDPRAWWKYAIQCIKSDVEQKHSAWSWMGIRERRDDKKQYVTLWHTLQLANMPEHFLGEEQVRVLQAELDAIETRRSVEDILLFRYLADVEMKKQHPAEMKTSAAQVSTASSYSLWNLVRWSGADSTTKSETADDMERQELYRILGYDPMDKSIAAHEYSVISIQLNQGSITLLNDPETKFLRTSSQYNRSYNPQPFFTALFAQVQTDIINVADSNLKMELSLQVMELYDESMDGHCILKRRVPVSTLSVEITMLTPVFRMSYESNASTDEQMLKLFMEPLEIIYSPTAMCWMHLSTFSTAPEALGLWAEMEMQAVNEFVNFKARTEAKVEYAMANRIPIAVDVRIQAPVIILPALDGEMLHCARLILDLGHVHFRTERLSNLDVDVMSSTHSRSKNSSALLSSSNMFAKQLTDEAESGEGATRWKEEFYDKFTCGMSNLHVMLLPPSVPYSPELLMHSTTPFSLVDPFHINVTLRKSVLPLDATLYQLYIHADLPALSIHLSVGQYQHLSKVLAGFKKQETKQATTMPMKSPVFPFTPRQKDNTTEDYEETQSVMSDDTWFSVEYGSDAEEQTVQDRLSLLTTINQASEAPGSKSPPRLTFKVPERSKPRIVRKVLDRRVCVCTVTIPIIQIHLMKTEDEAAGRVTGLVEGIKLRFAKRTLSTALRLRLASLAIDDHAENLPTHHVLFSCSTTPAMPFTSILPKSIRKTSLRRKVAVMLPSVAGEEAVDLLDINLTSEANEASQLDMTFGHLHVQFDQSRIAVLVMQIMPLLHEEDDPMESIPPLSLEDAIYEIPISLTESVRQDLEKARHSLLHQAKKEETTENRSSIYRIKLHVHSVSVCFSNHMENIMSMALLDARLQGTLAPSSVEFKGHLGNLHVIDLVSSDLLHMKRKDKRYMFQEVLGMSPPETNPPPPVLTVSMNQTLDKGRIQVTVQRIRCVLSTRFLLKTLHYVYEASLTLEGIKLGVKKDQNTAVDLSIAQIALQNTVISPGSKVQYRHNIDKSTHSLWFESQAFRVAVDAPFLTRMVVVCLEAMSNVEHAMARHQNQAVSELASSVYDDVSEYQWTERGRSNSIASSIHMTATAPTPVVWNFDVSCKLVQVECGSLVLAAQVACKKDQNQLYMKLQQVLVQTAQSTLLHPVEIVLRHYSQSSMDPSIERNLSPYHSHVPDTLLFSSVQCTPLTVSFHLQDVDVVVDSISKLTTLAKSLDRIHQQLRPVTVEGLQHAMSIGDNVVIPDGLDYSLQLLNDTNPPPTKPWQHVCIDLPSITVSVEAYSASVLSLNIEPSEFEWIGTPQVLSMTWKWQLDATYLNNRLLEMEPLLESMTMHLKLWQIIDATPLQIELKSVDEMKLNCTFALLETCRLLSRMTLEKELASIVIKNETGVTFKYICSMSSFLFNWILGFGHRPVPRKWYRVKNILYNQLLLFKFDSLNTSNWRFLHPKWEPEHTVCLRQHLALLLIA
ncbi:unnamed protein product [Aphanomyces euteiches]